MYIDIAYVHLKVVRRQFIWIALPSVVYILWILQLLILKVHLLELAWNLGTRDFFNFYQIF